MFKRAAVRTHLPLQAAEVTFGAWAARLMNRRERFQRWYRLRRFIRRGLEEMRTVAALTRYIDVEQLPDPYGDVVDFLRDKELLYGSEFDTALRDLNDFLVALGISTHELAIGPVAPADLPAKVPVIVERAERAGDGRRVGWTELHDLHLRLPDLARDTREAQFVSNAVAIFDASRPATSPCSVSLSFGGSL
jgi:hypothetical protein